MRFFDELLNKKKAEPEVEPKVEPEVEVTKVGMQGKELHFNPSPNMQEERMRARIHRMKLYVEQHPEPSEKRTRHEKKIEYFSRLLQLKEEINQ